MLPLQLVHVRHHLLHLNRNGLLALARDESEDLATTLDRFDVRVDFNITINDVSDDLISRRDGNLFSRSLYFRYK